MNILVLGHKQHGKGTFTSLCREFWNIPGISSSQYSLENIIFPVLAPKYGYKTLEECFNDRHSKREEWFKLIAAFNHPDGTALARAILAEHRIYDGMRNDLEFEACVQAKLFDYIFWVDASERKPLESRASMNIDFDPQLMIKVDNNAGPEYIRQYVQCSQILRLAA